MAAVNYKQVACYLEEEQINELKKIIAKTKVPMQVYLRYAVDELLRQYRQPARFLKAWNAAHQAKP